MKFFIAAVLSATVGLSLAASSVYPRGCSYANGRCVQECPVGTVSYTIDCGYVTREATCRDSRPKPDTKQSCGYSACHCVSPTVRDEATGQCVHLDKCPNARIIYTHGGGGVPKIQRRPVLQKPAPTLVAAPTAPVASQMPVFQRPVAPAPFVGVPQRPVAPTPFIAAPQRPVAPTAPVSPLKPVTPTAPQRPVVPTPFVAAPQRPVVPTPFVAAPQRPVAPTQFAALPAFYDTGYPNSGHKIQKRQAIVT